MPGVLIWGWDAVNKVWVKIQVTDTGKLKIKAG